LFIYKRRNSIPLYKPYGKGYAGTRLKTTQVLTLTLFVPWFDTNDANSAIASNDLAITAHFLYGSSNFHRSLQIATARLSA
jgi:hypothetical protein